MSENVNLRQQLHQMADEIRVKVHLAGMEAKDKWAELEPRLSAYEKKAEDAVGQVSDEFVAAGKQLKTDVTKLLDQLKAKIESA